jgi:VanZ family protein
MRTFVTAAAWFLVVLIVILSLVPPSYRLVTGAGHNLEHFLIFLSTGLAFGIGSANRWWILVTGLLTFAAAVELAQSLVPGRHARMSDFIINAAGACIGIALSSIGARLFNSDR